jgi:anti-sigma regulatory factor (Ser/Thr protein kinase)
VQGFNPAGIALVGAALKHAEEQGATVNIDLNSVPRPLVGVLRRNGFLHEFGVSERVDPGDSIPFRQERVFDNSRILEYLTDSLLGRDFLAVSQDTQEIIAGHLTEIYDNAFEHADSPVGVIACGYYSRKYNQAQFAAVDLGRGIVTNVRKFLRGRKRAGLYDSDALQWAFEQGHTTRPGREPRGNGLFLLREFVERYDGYLEIRSNSARAVIRPGLVEFSKAPVGVHGTLLRLTLNCDTAIYRTQLEAEGELEL